MIPALGDNGRFGVVVAVAIGLAGSAAAEPVASPQAPAFSPAFSMTIDGLPARRVAVDTPRTEPTAFAGPVSKTIYLERCRGGCVVHMGMNDARTNTSTIPMVQVAMVTEFTNSTGTPGTAADNEWRRLVTCMQEVYSPYNVVVTDVKPTTGTYHEAIIAGDPRDIGLGRDILGVAPLASDCSALDNVMSFSFANRHPKIPGDINGNILNVCWTAAQESAHAFGLDHEYSFVAGNRSACSDPMTYRNDCGGEKFFRNEPASCGETTTRPCKCGTSQNSHAKLVTVFGAGTPITGKPTAVLVSPTTGGALGTTVSVDAGAKRGVARVELYFNGFKWAEQPGAAFELTGQPDPSSYAIRVPADLPDSVVDVKAIAYDDLGASTESGLATVTKGTPCATAATCVKGQKCEAGKCFWDPANGEIGDDCSYAQFCKSGLCSGTKDQQICTQPCIPGDASSCPADFACLMSSPSAGVCFFASTGGGCCSVGEGDALWWGHLGLGAAAFGFVVRRRRRRR